MYFAAVWANEYGLAVLAADLKTLIDFRDGRFVRFLSELRLTNSQWLLLQYLAAEQRLPLSVIATALGCGQDEIARDLKTLVDHNLLVVSDDKYAVAPPLKESVERARGRLTADKYEEIRARLTSAFWRDRSMAPGLETVDATLHAAALSGHTDLSEYSGVVRVSNLHRIANEAYRRQNWDRACDFCDRALRLDPRRREVKRIKLKAVVQLERWEHAQNVLAELQKENDPHSFYLEGFILKRQRLWTRAAKAFQRALDSGDSSFPVRNC